MNSVNNNCNWSTPFPKTFAKLKSPREMYHIATIASRHSITQTLDCICTVNLVSISEHFFSFTLIFCNVCNVKRWCFPSVAGRDQEKTLSAKSWQNIFSREGWRVVLFINLLPPMTSLTNLMWSSTSISYEIGWSNSCRSALGHCSSLIKWIICQQGS